MTGTLNLLLIQSLNDFSIVLLDGDESDELDSVEHGEILLLDQFDVVLYLLLVGLSGLLKGIDLPGGLQLYKRLGDLCSPSHLSAGDEDLTLGRADDLEELLTFGQLLGTLHVVLVELEEDVLECLLHGLHESLKPLLDSRVDNHWLSQLNDFLLL
jgi:hypothetical protein